MYDSEKNVIKIIDLGISQIIQQEGQNSLAGEGTARYQSPE